MCPFVSLVLLSESVSVAHFKHLCKQTVVDK